MTLQELFDACLVENKNDRTRAAQQFIVKAKKQNPSIKMSECRDLLGFNKETEQTFRNTIVIPVRNRIGKIKFDLSAESVKRLFGRADLTEDEIKKKEEIASTLPSRSRVVKPKQMDHIDQLFNAE